MCERRNDERIGLGDGLQVLVPRALPANDGGIAYGQSDKEAANPKDKPVTPEDLAKTIYWALGINPELMSLSSIPLPKSAITAML